MNKNIK